VNQRRGGHAVSHQDNGEKPKKETKSHQRDPTCVEWREKEGGSETADFISLYGGKPSGHRMEHGDQGEIKNRAGRVPKEENKQGELPLSRTSGGKRRIATRSSEQELLSLWEPAGWASGLRARIYDQKRGTKNSGDSGRTISGTSTPASGREGAGRGSARALARRRSTPELRVPGGEKKGIDEEKTRGKNGRDLKEPIWNPV